MSSKNVSPKRVLTRDPESACPTYAQDAASLRLYENGYDREAKGALEKWFDIARPELPRGRSDVARDDRLLYQLLGSPIRLDEPAGRAAFEAMQPTGVLPPYAAESLELLVKTYGSEHLSKAHVIYNGHATEAMLSLVPTLRAMGLASADVTLSHYSGSGTVPLAMKRQVEASAGAVHWGSRGAEISGELPFWEAQPEPILPADASRTDVVEHTVRSNQALSQSTKDSSVGAITEKARYAAARGECVIVDKGGIIARNMTPELEGFIRNGTLRFIIHNQDDVAEFGPMAEALWAVDLWDSEMKALEAALIGQQYALFSASEARRYWSARIGDLDAYVIGAGLLGGSTVDAYLERQFPRQQLTVIECSEKKRAELSARGVKALDWSGRRGAHERPARATAVVATPGQAIDESNVHDFADELLVFAVTSGGKGVDLAGLRRVAVREEILTRRMGCTTGEGYTRQWADRRLDLVAPDGRRTRVTVVADAMPLNLIQESWPAKFALTSVAVAAAVARAAALKAKPDRSPPDRAKMVGEPEASLLANFKSRGHHHISPLDPWFRDPFHTATDLRCDLDAFRPA